MITSNLFPPKTVFYLVICRLASVLSKGSVAKLRQSFFLFCLEKANRDFYIDGLFCNLFTFAVKSYLKLVGETPNDSHALPLPSGSHLRDNEDALYLLAQSNGDTAEVSLSKECDCVIATINCSKIRSVFDAFFSGINHLTSQSDSLCFHC